MFCIGLAIALVAAVHCYATDRFYRDIKVSSPNGRFVFEAKSPDNAVEGEWRPFQKNFAYTLTDTSDGSVSWTRRQREHEGSPTIAWVDDDGWTVVRTGWDELLTFAPPNGGLTGQVTILDEFPADERAKYVHQTTAGPMWSGSSRWYFIDVDGVKHFVVRAHWGRRVIVELKSGKVMKDAGPRRDACAKVEHEWVLDELRTNTPRLLAHDDLQSEEANEAARKAGTAIDLAARDSIKEAIPLLRELEKSVYSGRCGTIPVYFMPDKRLPEGLVDPFSWCECTIRKKAKMALRRLGETPSELPVVFFCRSAADGSREVFMPTLGGSRLDGVNKIAAGMTPEQVLTLAGGPDAIANGRDIAWEYHIDGPDARAMQVFWKQDVPPVVARVERVTPPTWTKSDDIDW